MSKGFPHTYNKLFEKGLSTIIIIMSMLRLSLNIGVLETKEIRNLLLATRHMLVIMWSLGAIRRKNLVSRTSVEVKQHGMAYTTCKMV